MKKSILLMMALLVWMGNAMADEVVVNDVKIMQGGETTLCIGLNNTTEYTRFSLDLVLPEGITIVGQKLGGRFEGTDHRVRLGTWPNWYRLIGDTDESMVIPGNSGTLVEVTLKADESLENGEYQATLTGYNQDTGEEYGMEFTTTDDEPVLLGSVVFNITVGEEDIKTDEIIVDDVKIDLNEGSEGTLYIDLNNATEFTRFSIDLVLPEGFTVVEQKLGGRFEGTDHRLRLGTWPNWYRLIGDTDESMVIPGNSGTLVEVTLKADESVEIGNYTAKLTGYNQDTGEEYGMEFTKTDDDPVLLGSVPFGITVDRGSSITSFNQNQSNSKITNLQGQRMTTTQKGIYIVGGKKIIVK